MELFFGRWGEAAETVFWDADGSYDANVARIMKVDWWSDFPEMMEKHQ